MELNLETPPHAVPEHLGIYPRLGAQNDSFSDRQTYSTTNQVVRKLDHSATSQLSRVDNRVAECIEQRLYPFIGFQSPGRQHLQATVGNPIFTDNQRRIHDP